MTTEFQFGLKHRLYNWNMRSSREKRGWHQKDLGALVGCSGQTIGHLESLRSFPKPERAQKIAEVLECPVEILFPEWLTEFKLKRVPKTIEDEKITLEQARLLKLLDQKALITDGGIDQVETEADREILSSNLRAVLSKALTPREKRVIELRYGFGGRALTYEETGREFNVTRERIRQIEHKALRILRRPGTSRGLKKFLGDN